MLDAKRSTYAMLAEETPKNRTEKNKKESKGLEDISFVGVKSKKEWLEPCKRH